MKSQGEVKIGFNKIFIITSIILFSNSPSALEAERISIESNLACHSSLEKGTSKKSLQDCFKKELDEVKKFCNKEKLKLKKSEENRLKQNFSATLRNDNDIYKIPQGQHEPNIVKQNSPKPTSSNRENNNNVISSFKPQLFPPKEIQPKFKFPHVWESWEHTFIGNMAVRSSSKFKTKDLSQFKRLKGDFSLRYGQLVAFGGDFYADPGKMYSDEYSIFGNDIEDLKQCIDFEWQYIDSLEENHIKFNKCKPIILAWNSSWKTGENYISLALNNYKHFGWHNIKEYVFWHKIALDVASSVVEISKNPEKHIPLGKNLKNYPLNYCGFEKVGDRQIKSDEIKSCAFYINAYADHFLSDAFSAGHIRVPRKQLDTYASRWGESKFELNRTNLVEGSVLSGALVQALHDLEGKKSLWVTNEIVEKSFLAHGDNCLLGGTHKDLKCLNLKSTIRLECSEEEMLPVLAVRRSWEETVSAYLSGSPTNNYRALDLVPFPSSTNIKNQPLQSV